MFLPSWLIKMYKIWNSLHLEIFAQFARPNTPYSSSKANERGEKLKYVLKSYIRGTHHMISRMRNDNSVCVCERIRF